MTDQLETTPDNLSRRNLLLGLGAVAGATAGAALLSNESFASAAVTPSGVVLPGAHPRPEAVGAAIPGLTYVALDATAFFENDGNRLYQDLTGTQPTAPNRRIFATLNLPAGSVVYQMNVGYQGQPIAEISRRKITQTSPTTGPSQVFQKTLVASPGGAFSSTENLATPVTIEADSSYTVSFFCGAGHSVYNCSIGYLPPTQGFTPFTGATPRVFDSRSGAKFAINEERTVDLGFPGARGAVINLTVTETVGGGFVAIFPADITWPGNSSINWKASDQDVANGVITRVDATGKIKVRASSATHVVIDRIGFLL